MSRHLHICRCGAFFVCHQQPDHCPVKHWDCPVCTDRELDNHFAAQLAETERSACHEPQQSH